MTMFMHNLSAAKDSKISKLLHQIMSPPDGDSLLLSTLASVFPFLLKLPSAIKTWADGLRAELGVIAREVWDGKDGAGMHAKVLDSLNNAVVFEGQPISKDEAVAQIIGLLFAGSETTANVIAECLYELSRQPAVQNKLREELFSFQATHGHEPTYDDLMSKTDLPYLDAVTQEIIRTKAVLTEISRAVVEDDIIPLHFPIAGTEIKEIRVKAGQSVNIPVRDGVNVDEEIWGPDAATFRPERWIDPDGLPEAVDLIRAQGHMLTFGDGPKVCMGRLFALAEFKIIVSVIVRHFAFEETDAVLDFYHLGGNTVKPVIRGREKEGAQLPLRVVCKFELLRIYM